MALFSSKKALITLVLVFSSFYVWAQENTQVLCPSLTLLQKHLMELDAADVMKNGYMAYTSYAVVEASDNKWFILVYDVAAKNRDEAIAIGRRVLQEATYQDNRYASQMSDVLMCGYEHGKMVLLNSSEDLMKVYKRSILSSLS